MSWHKVQESWKKVSGTTKGVLGNLARGSYGARHGDGPFPEREMTDDSLRMEREKTDQAVAARQEEVAKHADAVAPEAVDAATPREERIAAQKAKLAELDGVQSVDVVDVRRTLG